MPGKRNSDFLAFAQRHRARRRRGDPAAFSRRARGRGQGRRAGYDPVTVADQRGRDGDPRARSSARIPITASAARSTAGARAASRYTWVIDPIDGTRSFILGPDALGDADRAARRRGASSRASRISRTSANRSSRRRAASAQWRRGGERRTLTTRRCRARRGRRRRVHGSDDVRNRARPRGASTASPTARDSRAGAAIAMRTACSRWG